MVRESADVDPHFYEVSNREHAALSDEGNRLLAFAADDATTRDVEVKHLD